MSTVHREVAGVGAFIVDAQNPLRGFVTVEEMTTKKKTNKLRGMKTYPMETIERGEDHNQALDRLFQEEVTMTPTLALTRIKLGQYELIPGVMLHTYLFEANSDVMALIGSASSEVRDPKWTTFEEVKSASIGAFRAGVYETVMNYLDYLRNPRNFQTRTYINLRDRIPQEVFEFIAGGASEKEALYHWIALGKFSVRPEDLIRL